jgi:hypothetical protein
VPSCVARLAGLLACARWPLRSSRLVLCVVLVCRHRADGASAVVGLGGMAGAGVGLQLVKAGALLGLS